MKSSLLPGGTVLLGLAAALTFLGVGYALFSDALRISGAVATGSVNAGVIAMALGAVAAVAALVYGLLPVLR